MNHLKARLHQELQLFDPQKGPQNQRDILTLLDIVLEQNDQSILNRAPPLDVIVYALNGILYPTFRSDFVSEFLRLFAMVEFYRIRAVEKATLAIEMNTYYHSSPEADPSVYLLSDEEEKYLTRLIQGEADMRKIYIQVVTQSCLFDLQRYWLSDSNTDFWCRWHEYLSVLDGTKSHPIHHKLSAHEIMELRNVGIQVLEFMKSTVILGSQFDEDSIHRAMKASEFQEAFLPKELPSHLIQAIKYHLDVVRDAIQKISMDYETSLDHS